MGQHYLDKQNYVLPVLAVFLVNCGTLYGSNRAGVFKQEQYQSKAKEVFCRRIARCSESLEIEKAGKSL